jgi:purine nucleosidase/pyrimidine-specific ribonucleoside hydrolase
MTTRITENDISKKREIIYNIIGKNTYREEAILNNMEKEKHLLILDTDIGDDIDDAYALSLLLAENAELLGVTTVYRNSLQRAKIASKLISLFGKSNEIKVYVGEDYPEKEPLKKFEKADRDGKANIPHYIDEEMKDEPVEDGAVDFILDTLKKHPNEVTIVAIGPLTNLARAIEKDKETFSLAKDILMMGGNFSEYDVEWNFLCDPEAAKTVFECGVPIKAVGVDITRKCTFKENTLECLSQLKSDKYKLLVKMTKIWIAHNEERGQPPTMHDPLAISTLFNDRFVTFKKGNYKIFLSDKARAMSLSEEHGAEIEYAADVNVEAFMQYLCKTLSNTDTE